MNIDPPQLLNALSDGTRLRITALLGHREELCVCDIVQALESVQPKVSKHLGILRAAGVITGRREGHWIHYRLNPELPSWASGCIDQLLLGCATRMPFKEDETRLGGCTTGGSCA